MEATVTKLKKNSLAEVWVSLRDFQGRQYVDIREHFLLAEDRQWHPTKKGIMILPDLLHQVIDGLAALSDATQVETVAKFAKSNREEIQIGLREYEGNRYGEIRAWYRGEDGTQKPGKGVTFKPSMIEPLAEALQSAKELLEK